MTAAQTHVRFRCGALRLARIASTTRSHRAGLAGADPFCCGKLRQLAAALTPQRA